MLEKNIVKMLGYIEESYTKVKKNEIIKEVISTSLIAATALGGVLSLAFGATSIGLGLLSLSVGTLEYRVKIGIKYNNIARRFEQEKRHLNKIRNDEIIVSNEDNQKRSNKIYALSVTHNYVKRKYFGICEMTGLTYAAIGVGAIITTINPVNIWLPIIGTITCVGASLYELDAHKEKESLENRINNLHRDLNISIILRDNKKENIESNEKTKVDSKKVLKTMFDVYEHNGDNTIDKPKEYIKNNKKHF